MRTGVVVGLSALTLVGFLALTFGRVEHTDAASLTAPVSGPITLDARVGHVSVVTENVTELRVQRTARWSGSDGPAEPTVQGGRVSLPGCSGRWWRSIAVPGGSCDVRYRITVPNDSNVVIRGDVGSVNIEGTYERLDVQTDVADIEGRDLSAPITRAKVSVGGLDLSYRTPPTEVIADVNVGSINVGLPEGEYDIRTQTNVGGSDVDATLRSSSGRRADGMVDLKLNVGGIKVVRSR